MPEVNLRRGLACLAGTLLALVIAGCPPRPAVRPVPQLGTEQEQILLTKTPQSATEHLAKGWALFLRRNQLEAAQAELLLAQQGLGPGQGVQRALAGLGAGLIALLQSDFASALDFFMGAANTRPISIPALVAAYQAQEVAHQVPMGHERMSKQIQTLLTHLQSAPLDPTAMALLRVLQDMRREGARRQGHWQQALAIEKEMGVPNCLRTQGPFGHHALADFDHAFGPELGSFQAGPPLVPRWPDLGRTVFGQGTQPGLYYAEAYFFVPDPGPSGTAELALRLESDDSWSVYVDGTALPSHRAHQTRLPRARWLAFKADGGWHRLLVKLSLLSDHGQLGIELIQRDDPRARLSWWSASQCRSQEKIPAQTLPPRRIQVDNLVSATQTMVAQAESQPHDPLLPLLAALLNWQDGAHTAARRQLNTTLQRAPGFALAHYLLGLLIGEDGSVPLGIDAARSRDHLQQALAKCPAATLIQFRKAWLDHRQGQHQQALAVLDRLESQQPGVFLWPYHRALIFAKLGWTWEEGKALRQALQILPTHADALTRSLRRARQMQAGDEAIRWAEKLAQLGRWDDLPSLYQEREQSDKAQRLLQASMQRFPSRWRARTALTDLLIGQGNYRQALKTITAADEIAPGHPEILERLAEIHARLGQGAKASQVRNEMARTMPWNIKNRQALQAMTGTQNLRLAGERNLRAEDLIRQYRASKFKPGGHAVLVLDQTAVEVNAAGAYLQHVHILAQVLSAEGIDRWGEIDFIPSHAFVEQVRTIKTDGQSLAAEPIAGKDTISLRGLQEGDFVEISYFAGYRGPDGEWTNGQWLGHRHYRRAGLTPTFLSLYSVAAPPQTMHMDVHGPGPEPQRSTDQGRSVLTWTLSEAVPLPREANSPPADEFTPFVQLGFGTDWTHYRGRLRAELDLASRSDPDQRKLLREILSGTTSREQELRQIFRWICAHIRQSRSLDDFSEPAAHTLARREGNRLVLLVSLLRLHGMRPHVYLARTVADAQVDYRFPNPDTFRHGLVAVAGLDANSLLWMDPAEKSNAFNVLYPFLQGADAIELTTNSAADPFVRLPKNKAWSSTRTIHLNLSLDEAGMLSGEGIERIPNAEAVAYRDLLGAMNPTERHQALQAGLSAYFAGAALDEYHIEALNDPDQNLILSYQFRVPFFASRRNNSLLLRGGFYPYRLRQSLAPAASRSTPLLLGDEARTATHIRLSIPPGASAVLPTAATLQSPLGHFAYAAREEGQHLVIDKSLLIRSGRVPAAAYPDFKEFCQGIDRKDREEIIIHLSAK